MGCSFRVGYGEGGKGGMRLPWQLKHFLPFLLARRQDAGRIRVAPLVFRLRLGLLEPRLEDRFQGDHVVVGQCQALEPTDGALRQRADAR